MSKLNSFKKKSIKIFSKYKREGNKFSCITCYDAIFAQLINNSDIDLVLVGDSLGNVVLGFDNTISVTMAHILHHTKAVARKLSSAFLVADMPFMSYTDVKETLNNAKILLQQGGAQAVKLEGGQEICPQITALTNAGVPVVGHIGLTPQKLHKIGGYKVIGKSVDEKNQLLLDAKALQDAGAFAVVLEMVPSDVAALVTQSLAIPTIGIGAGVEVDAQILVLHDLLGFDDNFSPKFLKKYANLSKVITDALDEYNQEVKNCIFPENNQL